VENNIFVEGGLPAVGVQWRTVKQHFWETTLPPDGKGLRVGAHLPTWKKMRGMDVPPSQIPEQRGRVMSGDVFTHNIIAWKNPGRKALNVVNFIRSGTVRPQSLLARGAAAQTGQRKAGKVISGNLAPNPAFQDGGPNVLAGAVQWPGSYAWRHGGRRRGKRRRSLRMDNRLQSRKEARQLSDHREPRN